MPEMQVLAVFLAIEKGTHLDMPCVEYYKASEVNLQDKSFSLKVSGNEVYYTA